MVEIRGVGGLERLYRGKQPWCTSQFHEEGLPHEALVPDPWGGRDGFVISPCFDGAVEVQAAESLYTAALVEARRALAEGREFAAAECGTCDGYSTAFIARAIEDGGAGGRVWSMELSRARSTGQPRPWPQLWKDLELDHRVVGIYGDTRRAHAWDGGKPPLSREIDFVFIDSEHSRGTVMAEWAVLGPRLRPGGVACFHDTALYPTEVGDAVGVIAQELGVEIKRLVSCRGLWMVCKPASRTG